MLPTEEITADFLAGWIHKENPWAELNLRRIPKNNAASWRPRNPAVTPETLLLCSESSGASEAEQGPA